MDAIKNYAIVLAGGVGSRMMRSIPKQYIKIQGKPLIIHTLQKIDSLPEIEGIVIVCAHDWREYVVQLIDDYHLNKIIKIVQGGDTSHDSIKNGVLSLSGIANKDDIIVVHESVRPFISHDILRGGIHNALIYGNSVCAITGNEALLYSDDGISSCTSYDREKIFYAQMPQFYKYEDLISAYMLADKKGIKSQSLNTLMFDIHKLPLYFTKGSLRNIKLTRDEDLSYFEFLLRGGYTD